MLCLVLSLAGCSMAQPPSPKTTKALAARYLAIATPANDQLDDEVDTYTDHEHHNLALSEADLRREVATERRFDEQLLMIGFPPVIAATAKALVRVNDRRIALTRLQSHAVSISELVSFDQSHQAADAAVEEQVRTIRKDLGLPPPDTS